MWVGLVGERGEGGRRTGKEGDLGGVWQCDDVDVVVLKELSGGLRLLWYLGVGIIHECVQNSDTTFSVPWSNI